MRRQFTMLMANIGAIRERRQVELQQFITPKVKALALPKLTMGRQISICLMELIKALIRLFQHPCSQILQLTLHGKLRNQLWWKAGSGIHFCNYCDTLESLLAQSQVITGKDLIKRKEDKELALFQEALEFEERHRRPRTDEENWNY